MFTLLRIRFYPFSYRSVLSVHTAPDSYKNGMKTMKLSHCSALDKKENATNWFTELRFHIKTEQNFSVLAFRSNCSDVKTEAFENASENA